MKRTIIYCCTSAAVVHTPIDKATSFGLLLVTHKGVTAEFPFDYVAGRKLKRAIAAALAELGEGKCRRCGCTDECGCADECWWIQKDLCSSCATPQEDAAWSSRQRLATGKRKKKRKAVRR